MTELRGKCKIALFLLGAWGLLPAAGDAATVNYMIFADAKKKIQSEKIITNTAKAVQTAGRTLETAQGALKTAQDTYNTLTTQLEAIELMGQGDYQSFVQGLQMQGETFGSLSATFRSLGDIGLEGFGDLATSAGSLSVALSSTTDALWAGNRLVEGSQKRMKYLKQLQRQTQDSDLKGQLQLQNTAVQLMSSELADMKQLLLASNNALAVQMEQGRLIADLREARYQGILKDSNDLLKTDPELVARHEKSYYRRGWGVGLEEGEE